MSKFLQILTSVNDNYSCTQNLLPLISLTFPQEYKSPGFKKGIRLRALRALEKHTAFLFDAA